MAVTKPKIEIDVAHSYDSLVVLDHIKFDVYASRTGINLQFSLTPETEGSAISIIPNIVAANTWQTVTLDTRIYQAVGNYTAFVITIMNADAANTFYVDNFIIAQEQEIVSNVFGTIT